MLTEEGNITINQVSIGDWVETVRGEVGEVTQLIDEIGKYEIELCVGRCFRRVRQDEIKSIIFGAN